MDQDVHRHRSTITSDADDPSAAAVAIAAPDDAENNEIHWLLFVQLALAIGLTPRRVIAGRTETLMLGFPSSGPSAARTATPAERRVLLVESQDIARVHAYRL